MNDMEEQEEYRLELSNEKAAERYSQESFRESIEKYRNKAISDFFRADVAVEFTESLVSLTTDLRKGIARYTWLEAYDHHMALDALTLPHYIEYKEYRYVGKRGNSDISEEFNEVLSWGSCDETDLRDEVVKAIYDYCIAGAGMAKAKGVERARHLFARAIEKIGGYCIFLEDNPFGGLEKIQAELVMRWITVATRQLWTEMTVEMRQWEWKKEDEAQNAAAAEKSGRTEIAENVMLGPWAAKFIKLDTATRTLTITTKRHSQKKFVVPPEYGKAWIILKWLLESTDPEGWYVIPEQCAELRDSWRAQFVHSSKPNAEMKELARYIHSRKKGGQRGPTALRLEQKPRPIVPQRRCKINGF